MSSDLKVYIEKQKHLLFEAMPKFLEDIQNGEHPLYEKVDASLNIFHEVEVLLVLKMRLKEYNQFIANSKAITSEKIDELIFETLVHGFTYLDDNGFVAGYDIDGKAYATNFHFFANLDSLLAFEQLGEKYKAKCHDMIRRTKNGVLKALNTIRNYSEYKIKAYRGLNLIFMDIATLYQAGIYFNEPDWQNIALKAKDRLLGRFDVAEGYMPDFRDEDENPGPSSTYFLYTMFTLTYLVKVNPDNRFAELLKRAVDWFLKTSYPCGCAVDIFDERGRLKCYTMAQQAQMMLRNRSPLFAYSKGGRKFLSYLEKQPNSKYGLQVLANDLFLYENILSKNPKFLEIMDEGESDWHTAKEQFSYIYQNKKSGVLKNGPWFFAGHGYQSGLIDPKSLWHRELQQHFSVYYHSIGPIIGGGNSLGQPQFSTLRTNQSYLCDNIEVIQNSDDSFSVDMINGAWQGKVTYIIRDSQNSEIQFELLKRGPGEAYFQLPFVCYGSRKELLVSNQRITDFSEQKIYGLLNQSFMVNGETDVNKYQIHLESSAPMMYEWPLIPVNVRLPDVPPLSLQDGVLYLAFPLHLLNKPIQVKMNIQIY